MDVEGQNATHIPSVVHDWDLLSARFQIEAAAYLQVVALLVVILFFVRRVRGARREP